MSHHYDHAAIYQRSAHTTQPAKPRQRLIGSAAYADKPAKKSRKLPTTPRSRVRSALRTVWLRSRERAARLKQAGNCCERCGVKASKAKGREVSVQVHHREGVSNWEAVIDAVYRELLVDPELLEAICEACHRAEHNGDRAGEPQISILVG